MRLFVAAFLPEEAERDLCAYVRSLEGTLAGVRWEPRGKLHATVRFIGEVAESRVSGLSRDIGERVRGSGEVESDFSRLRLFPGPKKPRVVAVGLSCGPGFRSLFEGVEDAVAGNGFGRTKGRFVPHVTVGRVRGRFGGAEGVPAPGRKKFLIRSVALVGSELRPGGSRYSRLAGWDLRGAI